MPIDIIKLQPIVELLDEFAHNKPPVVKHSKASKYVDQYAHYMLEKLHLIELANLEENSICLDISTGAGMLPAILESLGHECDTTDIPAGAEDKDPEQNHHEAYEYLRTHVFNIDITKYMTVDKKEPIVLPRKYDCIFSSRVVFNRVIDEDTTLLWEWEDYAHFINNLLEYTDRIIIKWNGLPDHIKKKMQDCIVEDQFVHGIITKHTQEL